MTMHHSSLSVFMTNKVPKWCKKASKKVLHKQDIGIAEQQNVGKQGRDGSIKQFSNMSPYIFFFYTHNDIYGKRCL